MNKEIKEILNEMKDICNVWVKVGGDMKSYNQDQMYCIYDYITNLQEEYDNEVEENLKLSEWLVEKQQEIEKYKSRIEKAVEILKNTNVDMPSTLLIETIDNGINILNGKE